MKLPRLLALLCATGASLSSASNPGAIGHAASPAFEAFPVVHEQPLFENLAIEGDRVCFWNRAYTLGGDGLLAAIDNGGETVLAAPMRLTGRIDGEDPSGLEFARETVESLPHAYLVRTRAHRGDVTLTTLTRIENDGMARFTIEIQSNREIAFEDLAIRIPLRDAGCDYLHYIAETRAKSASLELPRVEGHVWGSREARILYEKEVRKHRSDVGGALKNANVCNSFLPLVWTGNGSGGLAWFAESDAGWRDVEDRSIIELTRREGVLDLAVHVVMGRMEGKNLTIDFGVQATPVKPLPPRWRTWQHYNARGLRQGKHIERKQGEYDARIVRDFGDILMFDLDCIGFDTPDRFSRKIPDPEATTAFLQHCREKKYKVFTYITPFLLDQEEAPGDERLNWRRVPYLSRPWNQGGRQKRQDYLCHNAPGNLHHLLAYVESLVVEYDLDGVYIDVPFFNGGCFAPNCSYEREDGARQPMFRIFQMRDFYKKLASIFIRHGKYPLLLVHNSTGTLIPAYSWCWGGKPGEFMADIGYSMNHNEYFRGHRAKAIVELNPHPWGLVTFCMDDLKFTRYEIIRAEKDRPFAGKEEFEDHLKARYLGIPLLHDSLIMNWCSTPKFSYPIHRARRDFGVGEEDLTFHPYWDERSMKSGHPDVALSYYLRPSGAMLNLVNFSDRDVEFDLAFSPEVKAHIQGGPLHDPVSGETIPVENGVVRISIPAQLCRVLMYRND